MRKFTDVASGEVVVRKKVGAKEELDSLLHYIPWKSGVDLMELFLRGIIFILWHKVGHRRTLFWLEFIGSSHPVWMIQSVLDMTSPFLFGTILEINGNMSRRNSTGGYT